MRNLPFYWIAILSVIVFSITLTSFRIYVSLQKQFKASHELQIERTTAMNEVLRQLDLPVHLSLWMKQDRFLTEWIENGEKDRELVFEYLNQATQGYELNAFFASNKSRIYYYSDGSSLVLNDKTPDGDWFFSMLETGTSEQADVGYHNGNPTRPFLYIDMEIRSKNDEVLGYVGTAVELGRFLTLLENHKTQFDEDLHFVNQKGMVILSSRPEMVNTEASQYAWYKGYKVPSVEGETWAKSPDSIVFSESGDSPFQATFHVLDELGWLLVMENDHSRSQNSIAEIVWQSVVYLLVMLIFVGVFLAILFKRFKKDLNKAFQEIQTLKGILPICSACKKIRDDDGYWHQVESYIKSHSGADFTHSICRECAEHLYPNFNLDEIFNKTPL